MQNLANKVFRILNTTDIRRADNPNCIVDAARALVRFLCTRLRIWDKPNVYNVIEFVV